MRPLSHGREDDPAAGHAAGGDHRTGELETGGLLAALFGRVLQVLCRSFGQGGSGAGQMLDDTGGGNSWWTTTSTGWRTAGRSRDG